MKELRVGIAGLGRLGRVCAANFAYKIPGAVLTAACAPEPNVWNPSRSGLQRRTSRKWRNLSAASGRGGSRIPTWRTASMPHG